MRAARQTAAEIQASEVSSSWRACQRTSTARRAAPVPGSAASARRARAPLRTRLAATQGPARMKGAAARFRSAIRQGLAVRLQRRILKHAKRWPRRRNKFADIGSGQRSRKAARWWLLRSVLRNRRMSRPDRFQALEATVFNPQRRGEFSTPFGWWSPPADRGFRGAGCGQGNFLNGWV